MTVFAVRRLLGLIPVLFGISLLVFLIARAIPGDPATSILGDTGSPQTIERLREVMGLDKPLFFNFSGADVAGEAGGVLDSQYFIMMGQILRGDMGKSLFTNVSIRDSLTRRFPATLELALAAMSLAVVLGITAGIYAALWRGTIIDTLIMLSALVGVSFPVFWLAIILIYLFSVYLGWLPPSGRLDYSLSLEPVTGLYVIDGLLRGKPAVTVNAIKHLILPAMALGTIPLAVIVRMTRSAMLEVLNQDYIRTARAKGLLWRVVVVKHAFRNALLPVITVAGLSFGILLSGAILTETVFSWPGIGRWIYDAIGLRDYPVIQGGVLFVATIFVLMNLLVDLLYAVIDPRIQYS